MADLTSLAITSAHSLTALYTMTRGYLNAPSPVQLCYHLIYIAWPFLLGWWRHKWTAPKTKRNNGAQLQGVPEHILLNIRQLIFTGMEYAVSWHGSHRKYAVQCFFVDQWSFVRIFGQIFICEVQGPIRQFRTTQLHHHLVFNAKKVWERKYSQHKIHLQCSVKITSMQSKFENQNNQGTKHISNAMIAWPWGKISSTGGLRGSIITWKNIMIKMVVIVMMGHWCKILDNPHLRTC